MTVNGIYLAYPIDQVGPSSMVHFFQQVQKFEDLVMQAGVASWVFDPGDAFRVSPAAKPDDTLARINRAAHANADIVVAFLPAGVPSVGVPIEIDRAVQLGKPVVVFTDVKAWMLEYPPGYRRRIARYANWQDESLVDAIEWIGDLVSPTTQYDPDPLQVAGDEEFTPTRAYEDDAGYDLIVSSDCTVPGGGFYDVPVGVAVAVPAHTWGFLTGRSSAFRKRGLLVLPGVIDAGYRGPLFAGVHNPGTESIKVKRGERLAQLILIPNATRRSVVQRVAVLPESERGLNGFGSSGA